MKPFGALLTVETLEELFELAPDLHTLCFKEKLVLIRGLPPLERNHFISFANKVSKNENPFVAWDFGVVMELKEDPQSPNYLFSNERVPFHWDGAFHETPSIIAFNCIEAPKAGGRTLFSDPSIALELLDESTRSVLHSITIDYATEKKAHYGGRFSQPVISVHPITGQPTVRYGEEVNTDKNPVSVTVQDASPLKCEALEVLRTALYSDQACLRLEWEKGDLILADNHALLHGREAFPPRKSRLIQRIQLR